MNTDGIAAITIITRVLVKRHAPEPNKLYVNAINRSYGVWTNPKPIFDATKSNNMSIIFSTLPQEGIKATKATAVIDLAAVLVITVPSTH